MPCPARPTSPGSKEAPISGALLSLSWAYLAVKLTESYFVDDGCWCSWSRSEALQEIYKRQKLQMQIVLNNFQPEKNNIGPFLLRTVRPRPPVVCANFCLANSTFQPIVSANWSVFFFNINKWFNLDYFSRSDCVSAICWWRIESHLSTEANLKKKKKDFSFAESSCTKEMSPNQFQTTTVTRNAQSVHQKKNITSIYFVLLWVDYAKEFCYPKGLYSCHRENVFSPKELNWVGAKKNKEKKKTKMRSENANERMAWCARLSLRHAL